ncbi:MAG TPA: ABC transporter permease [Pyrinomonadaceae bacterium]|nr:ABC transporter permease [Pyrinomonadaceae bacterium]
MISDIFYDLRYALRLLRKSPGFALVAVFTLALGIGANAAIFSLTDSVLLQSLPVTAPDQLTTFMTFAPTADASGNNTFSYPMYQDLRDKNDVFSGVLARGGAQMNVSYDGRNDRVSGELVSGNYFEVLGVRPWVGRLFTQDDDRVPGGHPVAVLSYGFWQSRFAKDPNVVGKTILVNEQPLTVVGVSPPGFYGIELAGTADVRVPLMMTSVFNPVPKNRLTSRNHWWLTLMARRKDGVTLAQAQAATDILFKNIRATEAQGLPADISEKSRQRFFGTTMRLSDGSQGYRNLQKEMKTPLLLLFGGTCIVLLILGANLANLMLARDAAREQEVGVRLALGARRLRLLRQWLTEAILLAALGAIAGLVIASWVKSALVSFMPPDFRMNLDRPLGWRFIVFTSLLSLLVGVGVGLAPALRAAWGRPALALHGENRTFASGSGFFSLRSGLILVQVTLSVPLLIVSALFLNSLQHLRGVDAGFGKKNVLIASVNPALNGYSTEKSRIFFQDLLQGVRALPGVQSASLSSDSPISGGWDELGLVVEGYQPREGERVNAQASLISPDFFRSLEIPLVAGRDFNEQDVDGATKVTIINEKMARRFFGSTNPLGRKIGTEDQPDTVIVGVVRDAKYLNLREPALSHFYEPVAQQPRLFDLTMHIRTVGEPTALVDQVRWQVQHLDPHLPIYGVTTLDTQIDESITQERLLTWLCTAFGLLAALLTALGIYGVLAFSVAQRTREIGIRLALGAQTRDVLKLILGQGALLVTIGVALGLGLSFVVTKLIASLLFGVTPTNALTFATVSLGLGLLAMIACYIPARRATKVDPLVALRYE